MRTKSLFISDVHLGTRGCQADRLMDFLSSHQADNIYLIGDIVDGWRLKLGWYYWPQRHTQVVQELLRKMREGSRLTYILGNHDQFLREYLDCELGGFRVVGRAIHEGADGRRYLVTHGDECDLVIGRARWLAVLGSWVNGAAQAVSSYLNVVLHRLGLPKWSMSAWAEMKVRNAINRTGRVDEFLAAQAKAQGAHGVICGHLHCPEMHDNYGVRYINVGDWVESCTGLLEYDDGRFEIVHWADPALDEAQLPAMPSGPVQTEA